MINIIDMNTRQGVPNCVIDGQRIIFIDPKLEEHVVFLNYNAGKSNITEFRINKITDDKIIFRIVL